jgi:hypothetical protein
MSQPDTLNDLGHAVTKSLVVFNHVGHNTIQVLKFLLYDITLMLRALPFGNWVSIIYFVFMSAVVRDIVGGGELNHLLVRYIDIYFIQKKTHAECLARFQSYLWRKTMSYATRLENMAYDWAKYTWNSVSGSVKNKVRTFAKELISENAENIETTVTELSKTAAFSVIVSVLSQKLVSEMGPVAFDTFAKTVADETGILKLCSSETLAQNARIELAIEHVILENQNTQSAINTLSTNLGESIEMIMDAEKTNDLSLLENNILLNNKLNEISVQLEYLRTTQPNQFREILQTISLSTLALNDIASHSGLPTNIMNVLSVFSGKYGSSASQKGNRRIENI